MYIGNEQGKENIVTINLLLKPFFYKRKSVIDTIYNVFFIYRSDSGLGELQIRKKIFT